MSNPTRSEAREPYSLGRLLSPAPLLVPALGFSLGIVADHRLRPSFAVYAAALIGATAFACLRRPRASFGAVLICTAAFGAGGALHLIRVRAIPDSSIAHVATDNGRIVRLRGRVLSRPQQIAKPNHEFARWSYGANTASFLMEVMGVEGTQGLIEADGRVRVTVGDPLLDLRAYDEVEIFGRLFNLRPPRNPGSFDWAEYNRLQGIVAHLRCEHRENVRLLPRGPISFPLRTAIWLRNKARGLLMDDMATGTPDGAGLLEALVLGHRSQVDRELNEVCVRSGCVHFIAASGSNVAIVIGFVWFIARLLRQNKNRCAWLMLIAVLLYAVIAEAQPPILRATVMVVVYCTAYLLGRPINHVNSLSCALLVLLLFSPAMLFDIGLQFSFAAVAGVAYLGPCIGQALHEARLWIERRLLGRPYAEADRSIIRAISAHDRRPLAVVARTMSAMWRYLGLALGACIGAWLAGIPIGAMHMQTVQPWAALASALVYPLFSMAMLLGAVKLVLGAVAPTLGTLVGVPLRALHEWLLMTVRWLAELPGASLSIAPLPFWIPLLYYVALLAFVLVFHPRRGSTRPVAFAILWAQDSVQAPRWWGRVGGGAFVGLLFALWVWNQPPRSGNSVLVTFLAVGRGSATVLQLPDGATVLHDAGTSYPWDVGQTAVLPFLRDESIRTIDRIMVSHANLDHFSGIPSIVDAVPSGPVVVNNRFKASSKRGSPARHLLQWLEKRSHPVETSSPNQTRYESNGVTWEILWPPSDLDESWSANDTSTVLRLTYAGRSILFTGDIEEPAQRALMDKGNLRADVLVLPHHGSVTDTLSAFLEAVAPRAVIRSHFERMEDNINGLSSILAGIPVYNTADLGAIQVTIGEDGLDCRPALPP